ncbi:MAG: helix-turn-helix transcriptional regulator [Magnetococcales bacterium]|nr:helix-turn-helix transcriptional regulator [Magnetococcales bacterium]
MGSQSINQEEDSAIRERLALVIGNEEPYPWAARIGIGKSTFAGVWRNGAVPQTKTLLKIAQHTDISVNWLLTGRGPIRLDMSASPELVGVRKGYLSYVTLPEGSTHGVAVGQNDQQSATPVEEMGESYRIVQEEFCHVPRFGVQLGSGRLVQSEHLVDNLSFKVSWIEQVMGLDIRELALVHVTGDSMEPTLKEGDILLLDRRGFTQSSQQKVVRSDAIYVLLRGDELVAKRLQFGFDGSLTVQSDNPAYASQSVAAEQMIQLPIIGRVVWVGRRV